MKEEYLKFFFRFESQVTKEKVKDKIKPPTHKPEITSSIPIYLHKPRPEAIAMVQTGQVA